MLQCRERTNNADCFMEAAFCVHVPYVHCCWYLLVKGVGKAIVCICTCLGILAVNTVQIGLLALSSPFLVQSMMIPYSCVRIFRANGAMLPGPEQTYVLYAQTILPMRHQSCT